MGPSLETNIPLAVQTFLEVQIDLYINLGFSQSENRKNL